jgi:hypothetical protein
VLSDREREALRDIERRLRWESPQLVRLFTSTDPPPVHDRGKRARARALIAAALVAGLTLRGPRMLSEAEVSAHNSRPPLARRSPCDNAATHRATTSGLAAEDRHHVLIELDVGQTRTVSPSSGRSHAGSQRTDTSAAEPAHQTIRVASPPIALARKPKTNDRRRGGTGEQQ